MPSTALAAATGLPASIHPIAAHQMPRRGFLAGLAKLPLIGGSIALVGPPSAVAEPVTLDMMQAYKTWLHFEHRSLSWEMAARPEMVAYYGGNHSERYHYIERLVSFVDVGDAARFHRHDGSSPASERAALVLSTVGCDWNEPEDQA